MIGVGIGLNAGAIVAIYLALLLFGLAFNIFTAWVERKGYIHGFTSLLVVVGVAITLAATAIISLTFALITAGAFMASGTPMIVGSIWRHVQDRERMLEQLRQEARDAARRAEALGNEAEDGDEAETLAK